MWERNEHAPKAGLVDVAQVPGLQPIPEGRVLHRVQLQADLAAGSRVMCQGAGEACTSDDQVLGLCPLT